MIFDIEEHLKENWDTIYSKLLLSVGIRDERSLSPTKFPSPPPEEHPSWGPNYGPFSTQVYHFCKRHGAHTLKPQSAPYKRMTHFNERFRQFSGVESRVIPQEVFDLISPLASKWDPTDPDLPLLVRQQLKDLSLPLYYRNIYQLIRKFTNMYNHIPIKIEYAIQLDFMKLNTLHRQHMNGKSLTAYGLVLEILLDKYKDEVRIAFPPMKPKSKKKSEMLRQLYTTWLRT